MLIIGAGSHGKVVCEIAQSLGYEKIDYIDDNFKGAIGKIAGIEKFLEYENAFCRIGNNVLRGEILERLRHIGYSVPILIHPTAYVDPSASIENGTVVEPKAIVNANSIIKTGAIISVGSIVDHDSLVGKCSHINAGAIVKAGGTVEAYMKLEAGEVKLGYPTAIVER